MHDLETRQLAWDYALITGFQRGLSLKKTFCLFAHAINLRNEDATLNQALEGVKRLPPNYLTQQGCGVPLFIAQCMPRINDKLYDIVFGGKKRDIYDVILALNKSSVDAAEQPCGVQGTDQRRLRRAIIKDEGRYNVVRGKLGSASDKRHDWATVKAVRPR